MDNVFLESVPAEYKAKYVNVFLESVLAEYKAKYVSVFRNFYPAMGSTGFPERNLSVNFSKAFETVAASRGYDVYSWFELQMRGNGKKDENGNKHCDALIVDNGSCSWVMKDVKIMLRLKQ